MDKIEFLLLFLASVSSAVLIIYTISYVDRKRHIAKIKSMLTQESDSVKLELLKTQQKKYKNSLEYKLRHILNQAGIYNYQLTFFFVTYLLIVLFFSSLLIAFLHNIWGAVVGILFGTYMHYTLIKSMIERRRSEFNKALAVAISVLVKMMRNGIGFEQSMYKAVDVSASKMFKSLFERFFQEKNTLGERQAFENMFEYIDSKELKIFAVSVKIGRESGGRFSQTLEKLEQTIRHRKKMQDKIDVVTREASMGSYIIAVIAGILYIMLNFNFHGKLHSYYMESPTGRYQLLGIIVWILLGLVVNKAITKVKQ